jgi:hypothetical protein
MSESPNPSFQRDYAVPLAARLREPRRFLQVLAGPRQVGKTTMVQQVLGDFEGRSVFVSADEPALRDTAWVAAQWERARLVAKDAGKRGAVLVLDEVQKIPAWSEAVKRLWDEDTRTRLPLRIVLLGSAPLLVQRGLSESLAGRFEILHLPHWSFAEMRAARMLVAIEVKSGRAPVAHSGLAAFKEAFKPTLTMLVGGDGTPVEEFLSRPVTDWLRP